MSRNISEEAIRGLLERLPGKVSQLKHEISKRIFGQENLIDNIIVSILCKGHCLLIGVPGLAKTLLIKTISDAATLDFKRVQFTPDMMPSDITGSQILEEDQMSHKRVFEFVKGPVFTQLLLADEINRTPPKTQAALLEAMEEHHVTGAGIKMQLPEPFFVLATQNPIEQEGTYPLPEAQLDRFMFSLNVDYPEFAEELKVFQETTTDRDVTIEKIITADEIINSQAVVRHIPVPGSVAEFAVKLVRATRPSAENPLSVINNYVKWGAGPRACQYLALAGKARAALNGRLNVSMEDIILSARPVLRHRLVVNFRAEADNRKTDDIIDEVVEAVKKS